MRASVTAARPHQKPQYSKCKSRGHTVLKTQGRYHIDCKSIILNHLTLVSYSFQTIKKHIVIMVYVTDVINNTINANLM